MEEKVKMNWSFLRFNFKNRDKTTNNAKATHGDQQEQPVMRQVYANARAGDKVSLLTWVEHKVTVI